MWLYAMEKFGSYGNIYKVQIFANRHDKATVTTSGEHEEQHLEKKNNQAIE